MDLCLERFDFYSDVVFVCIAYSCHWEWANVSAVVLVIATFGQGVGAAVASGDRVVMGFQPPGMDALLFALLGLVPHPAGSVPAPGLLSDSPAVVACHALARVVLEDLPQARGSESLAPPGILGMTLCGYCTCLLGLARVKQG